MHGAKGRGSAYSWTRLSDTASIGSNVIKLVDAVASTSYADNLGNICLTIFLIFEGWKAGDLVIIPSTDFSPTQTEVFSIQSVIDSKTVVLNSPVVYTHFGQITAGVDERAEVALLTRSIFISGTSEGLLGGHIVFL